MKTCDHGHPLVDCAPCFHDFVVAQTERYFFWPRLYDERGGEG